MSRLISGCCFLGFALLVAGCQKAINLEKTTTLTVGAVEASVILSAPRSEQKIRVSIASADPVDVDIVLETNREAVTKTLLVGKRPAGDMVVASMLKAKTDTVSATIPAGMQYAIVLSGATKSTDVKLTMKSE